MTSATWDQSRKALTFPIRILSASPIFSLITWLVMTEVTNIIPRPAPSWLKALETIVLRP
ncbi:MAG: hypothetical protein A4E51_01098 [Methanosaeta sp. PtaU1.Bin055]|nr:MAG: hypothetical protein A4E51_01098 [Methanosaeta sp. PtaU1.Bin055]